MPLVGKSKAEQLRSGRTGRRRVGEAESYPYIYTWYRQLQGSRGGRRGRGRPKAEGSGRTQVCATPCALPHVLLLPSIQSHRACRARSCGRRGVDGRWSVWRRRRRTGSSASAGGGGAEGLASTPLPHTQMHSHCSSKQQHPTRSAGALPAQAFISQPQPPVAPSPASPG
jgi:hypothetical protein